MRLNLRVRLDRRTHCYKLKVFLDFEIVDVVNIIDLAGNKTHEVNIEIKSINEILLRSPRGAR